jgi:hypothetical protein
LRDREKRMSTMTTLVHAVVAEAPFTFITKVALPVAGIGECETNGAKHASLETFCWVLVGGEVEGVGYGTSRNFSSRSQISVPRENMRGLMVRWISSWRCLSLVAYPSSVAEAIPMQAALSKPIATQTKVVVSAVTFCTVVMKVVLYTRLSTAPTVDLRLGV